MHADLEKVIARSHETYAALRDREIDVKEANARSKTNDAIISSHAIDLRERMFLAEHKEQGVPAKIEKAKK